MFDYQKISIDKLILWKDNARYTKTLETEKQCLNELFGNKVMNQKQKVLLDDIFLETNVIEDCIVYKEEINENEYQYVVLDGNRRISLFKIFSYPELIKKYGLDLVKLNYVNANIKSVYCKVYDDLHQAYKNVELRHMDEQKGKGTVKWGSENKDRMLQIQNKKVNSIGFKIMRFYESTTKPEFQNVKAQVKDKSTLDRIFGFKNTYNNIFGLKSKEDYNLYNYEHQLKVNDVLEKFYKVGGKVSQVYSADLSKKLFEDVEPLPENKNQMTMEEIDNNDFNNVTVGKDDDIDKSTISSRTPNRYTVKGANLFSWTGKGIKSNNSLFNYYFGKLVVLTKTSNLEDELILDIAPYFYRLLLDIAISELNFHINSGKGDKFLSSSYSKDSFNTTTTGVSCVNKNKIVSILNIYDNLKRNGDSKSFSKYKTVLNQEQFTVKNESIVSKFVQDLNDVIHGSSKTLSPQTLEKYDKIVIALLQSIYHFINLT